jgi:hypothetical protein
MADGGLFGLTNLRKQLQTDDPSSPANALSTLVKWWSDWRAQQAAEPDVLNPPVALGAPVGGLQGLAAMAGKGRGNVVDLPSAMRWKIEPATVIEPKSRQPMEGFMLRTQGGDDVELFSSMAEAQRELRRVQRGDPVAPGGSDPVTLDDLRQVLAPGKRDRPSLRLVPPAEEP